jgi:hypothetical protein
MSALLRWLAFLIFAICCAVSWDGTRSWVLVLLMTASILVFFGTYGAFRKSTWIGTPEDDATYCELDAQIRAHETWREERLRRVIT